MFVSLFSFFFLPDFVFFLSVKFFFLLRRFQRAKRVLRISKQSSVHLGKMINLHKYFYDLPRQQLQYIEKAEEEEEEEKADSWPAASLMQSANNSFGPLFATCLCLSLCLSRCLSHERELVQTTVNAIEQTLNSVSSTFQKRPLSLAGNR